MTDEAVDPKATDAPEDVPAAPAPQDAAPAPPDWRKEWAAGDEKIAAMLGRYNSQQDVAKALHERNKQIDSGVYRKNVPFPSDAADDVKAQWRKENGVPATIAEYKLPEGLVIGEADRPVVDEFLQSMHNGNVPDGIPQRVLDWYFKAQEAQAAKAAAESVAYDKLQERTLRTEWGGDYDENFAIASHHAVEFYGKDAAEILLSLGATVTKGLAKAGREVNPAATIVPHSNNPTAAIADEKSELEKRMRNIETWKRDVKGQARYQEIVSYERKTQGRR